MQTLDAIARALSRFLLGLGAIVLTAMMCLACANMVLRAVGLPIKGAYELMGYCGALAAALALAATQRAKGHIALTLLKGFFPRSVDAAIDAASSLAGAVFFGLVAWRTGLWARSLMVTGELSETLRVAYYPFPFIMAAGCALMALILVLDAVSVFRPQAEDAPS